MTMYRAEVDGEFMFEFEADLADAAALIVLEGDATPFQTADCRHRPVAAAELLNEWARGQGGEFWAPGAVPQVQKIA